MRDDIDSPDTKSALDAMDNITLCCSFCGSPPGERSHLITGPSVHICTDCARHFEKLIDLELSEQPTPALKDLPNPHRIHRFLDDYVIGQEQAKKVLSVSVYNHYKRLNHQARHTSPKQQQNRIELGKSNLLLIGPSGSGKTLLVQSLARMLDVPFAMADATSLTESGYVGEDVENVLHSLLADADFDPDRAEQGIVFIDEIDKLSRRDEAGSQGQRDVSGEGVQQALLRMLEGTVARVPLQESRNLSDPQTVSLNTRNILFICGGAFAGLDQQIQRRLRPTAIGFHHPTTTETASKNAVQIEYEDLEQYGLIPELIGRLPIITRLEAPDESILVRILQEPRNALVRQYQRLFEIEQIALEFTDEALHAIARLALQRKTGARGLRNVLEDLLLEPMYQAPGWQGVDRLLVHQDMVSGLSGPILDGPDVISAEQDTDLPAQRRA